MSDRFCLNYAGKGYVQHGVTATATRWGKGRSKNWRMHRTYFHSTSQGSQKTWEKRNYRSSSRSGALSGRYSSQGIEIGVLVDTGL